jgi:hypothetical protein
MRSTVAKRRCIQPCDRRLACVDASVGANVVDAFALHGEPSDSLRVDAVEGADAGFEVARHWLLARYAVRRCMMKP